jgi:uncharacterized protein
LESVDVVFRGGEPLLVGNTRLESAAEAMRRAVPDGWTVGLSVQTNGPSPDERMPAVLQRQRIRVGVSLNGPVEVNDRHRLHADGRGNYAGGRPTVAALGSTEHASLFGRNIVHCAVRSEPVSTYRALLEFGPPMLDFLPPHGNRTTPRRSTILSQAIRETTPSIDDTAAGLASSDEQRVSVQGH